MENYYIKQTIRNRCNILEANGPMDLIVPVKNGGSKQLYKDVKISYEAPWPQLHLKTLASAYGNSPFYFYHIPVFEKILTQPHTFLVDLNFTLLEALFKLYRFSPNIVLGKEVSEPPKNPNHIKQAERAWLAEMQPHPTPYTQVFSHKFDFVPGLSIIDKLFNCPLR